MPDILISAEPHNVKSQICFSSTKPEPHLVFPFGERDSCDIDYAVEIPPMIITMAKDEI